jgi:Arginase family
VGISALAAAVGALSGPVSGYRLIVVPTKLGRLTRELVELDPAFNQTGRGEVDACFELIRLVADQVRSAVEDGALPVILSGSCFAGVGVVAGLAEPDPAVVWFDAHSDFQSPDASTEGYFDGIGLAVLTGGAWQAMHARVPPIALDVLRIVGESLVPGP